MFTQKSFASFVLSHYNSVVVVVAAAAVTAAAAAAAVLSLLWVLILFRTASSDFGFSFCSRCSF